MTVNLKFIGLSSRLVTNPFSLFVFQLNASILFSAFTLQFQAWVECSSTSTVCLCWFWCYVSATPCYDPHLWPPSCLWTSTSRSTKWLAPLQRCLQQSTSADVFPSLVCNMLSLSIQSCTYHLFSPSVERTKIRYILSNTCILIFFSCREKILNTVNYFYSRASFACENRHNFRKFFFGEGVGGGQET